MCHSRICANVSPRPCMCTCGTCVCVSICECVSTYGCRPAARLSGCLCPVPRGLVGWRDTRQRCPCEKCLSSVSLDSGRPWTWPSPRRTSERQCTAKRERTVQTTATLLTTDKDLNWTEEIWAGFWLSKHKCLDLELILYLSWVAGC